LFGVRVCEEYANVYPTLCDWLTGAINNDFTVSEKPFNVDIKSQLPSLTKGVVVVVVVVVVFTPFLLLNSLSLSLL
jgi:hypothetical protein